ncbi:MAG: fimbrillin family protein [Parabacteroides sp.]
MKRFISIVTASIMALSSCDNTLDTNLLEHGGGVNNPLTINVLTDRYSTKDVNLSNALPDGSSIGLFMRNVDPNDLYQHDLRNFKFTATSNEEGQLWQPEHVVYLNNELCSIHAYYPYDENVTDITAIPVTTDGQTDYMYTNNDIKVNTDNNSASLSMKHALAAITLNIVKGTYEGTGLVTKLSLNGSGMAKRAKLNAETGELYDFEGENEVITQNINLTMDGAGQSVHTLIIPNDMISNIKISLCVDGNEYYVVAPGAEFEQATRYEYTLTVDQDVMGISNVHVGDWGYDGMGNPILWIGNHSVTFDGNYADIAFGNQYSDGKLIIKAINYDCNYINKVSVSTGAEMTQIISGNTRIITLSNITSDIVLTFNGVVVVPPAISENWDDLADGVYAVRPDLKPANANEGNENCIGVGLVNSATGQKFMIEKLEDLNPSYQQTFVETGATGTNYSTFYWGYYGKSMNELLNISRYTDYTSAYSGYSYGYLPDKNGVYSSDGASSSYKIGLPDSWPNGGYAISDKEGYQHSLDLMKVKDSDGLETYPKMGQLLSNFIRSEDAIDFNDWYIPACGQLGLFYVYLEDINKALEFIGGKQLATGSYWSSTEYNSQCGWIVQLSAGSVLGAAVFKSSYTRIRFIRDL